MVAEAQVPAEPQHAVRHEWEARGGTARAAAAFAPMSEPKGPQQGQRQRRSHRVSDLIDTTEMYLRTIYELQEEGIVPLRARIAERLGQRADRLPDRRADGARRAARTSPATATSS